MLEELIESTALRETVDTPKSEFNTSTPMTPDPGF